MIQISAIIPALAILSPLSIQVVAVPQSLLSQLQGEWMFGALSFTNDRDAYTGRLADDGGGIGDKIKINPDGSYERAARMKLTVYSCTTRLAIWEKGSLEIADLRITFRPSQGVISSRDWS